MKLKFRTAFFLFSLVQCCASLRAQVATSYSFSQFSSSYQAISTGTVFGNSTSDDLVFVNPTVSLGANYGTLGPGLDIGFSFMYNTVRYDRIGVCNDGWITFGHSTLGNSAVNTNVSNIFAVISATSNASPDLQNRIAVLSRDLQGQSGSELRVATLGNSPTRTCVVQWTNYRKYNATGDALNFQIRLYETSHVVEFVYGTFINGAANGNAQVGLRGTTNSDFSNRITNTTNTWSNSISGTVNNAAVNFDNSGLVPSYGQTYRWTPPQCSGTLSALSASVNPSFICANASATVNLLNSYTLSGITYTWSHATSSSGPYTLTANTNDVVYETGPIPTSYWFQAISTCINNGSTVTSLPINVQVAAPIVNTVPYFESFEGLILNNQLPNCSWLASNMPSVCQTYTNSASNNRLPFTGNKYASFTSGTNTIGDYFYTNGIQLNAGVIYSASVAYITDGNAGWNNFSLWYGSAQTVTNLTPIDSVISPTNVTYSQLSHTFTVPSSSVYVLAIKCIANTSPLFLSFDDIKITAPCHLNAPTLSLNSSTNSICSGNSVILTALGANTYSWSNGVTSAVNPVSPTLTTIYSVVGTHTASGCTSISTTTILVKASPTLAVSSNTSLICSGAMASLTASGAISYSWSNNSTGPSVTVSPTITTAFSVYGENTNFCGAFATLTITVIPAPDLNVISTATTILCLGETATLTASGAVNYQWFGPDILLQSNPVFVKPTQLTTYTIVGTAATSCTNTIYFTQDVGLCAGVQPTVRDNEEVHLYPNPGSNQIKVVVNETPFSKWQLFSNTGQMLLSGDITGKETTITIENLAKGAYYLKLLHLDFFIYKKIVKN